MRYKKYIAITLIILFVIIIFLIFANYRQLTKTKDSLEICQIEKNIIDKIILANKENCPLIIKEYQPSPNIDIELLKDNNTKISGLILVNNKLENQRISIHKAYSLYKLDRGGFNNIIIKGLLDESLEKTFREITSPLSIYTNTMISFLPKIFSSPLTRRLVNLNLFLVEEGSINFQLYHPKYHKFLAKDKKECSVLDGEVWNTIVKVSDQANYIEIIVRSGQALIIPFQWIYKYNCLETSRLINFISVDMIGSIVFRLEGLKTLVNL